MLEISPLIMAVTFVIFLTLLYMLNQKLYRPLLTFMDDRDATLEREMREAQNLTGNTRDLEAEAAAIVDAARNEASRKRQQILEELQTQHQQAIEARQSELAKTYETFKTALAQERETLKSKLISELPLIKETLKAKFSQI